MTDVIEQVPRVGEVAELAAAHARRAEHDRRLTPEVFAAIRDAGFARHFVATRWGGSEGGYGSCLAAVAELSRHDPSAGWCAAIAATLGRMAGFLPEAGARTVWADGPDAFVVGALVPGGHAAAVPGGWTLSGKWPYVSGIHASDHALLATRVSDTEEVRFLLVPRSAYRVEHTWRTVGMRGTGSDTLVLDPAFVPVDHSFALTALATGLATGGALGVPLTSVSGLTFAAPVLGAARGALDAWTRGVVRKRSATPPRPEDTATVESTLSRAAAEIDAADLLLSRAARAADLGGGRDKASGATAQRDQVFAVELLLDAVNRLQRTGGTGAQDEDDDLQRFWRDANAGAGHAVLRWEPAARRFATASLTDG